MNGSTSPGPTILSQGLSVDKVEPIDNIHTSATIEDQSSKGLIKASPVQSADGHYRSEPDALVGSAALKDRININGEDDGASEAETLIDSPVKKREAARASIPHEIDKSAKTRIGSLPVPGEDDDDDTTDSHASPMRSVEMTDVEHSAFSERKCKLIEHLDNESDKENSSGSLTSPRSSSSHASSRGSSRSRAHSEQSGRKQHDSTSSNPRKRKHRASSVSLPNKRSSAFAPSRRLRGLYSEDIALKGELSMSPPAHGHKRALSMQSALTEGDPEAGNRQRRAATQLPARESKSVRSGWEESDGSSETTSQGHNEYRRPQRGIGRATSTPGRPPGREHKRHVNKYGFTRLAEACEDGDLSLVKEWRGKDADQLELAEFAGNKPLQIAALNGNDEVVKYLIDQGCQIDCANVDKDTPLIDAAENGHLEVVRILLESGVDPLRQNLKGQQALDVVTDDTDDADGIRAALREAIGNWNSDDAKRRREQEEEARHAGGPNKELHFMARSYENLLKLVTNNDRNGVREFLAARVPVDNALIAAAARTGDEYLVNMLLAEITDKKAYQKPEKPVIAVLGSSHFDMLKLLTQLGQFNPTYRNRAGKSWPELAEERNGPNCSEEKALLQHLYDQRAATIGRRSSSPVSKRDQMKRRFKEQSNDEDGNDKGLIAPKRKNGRRLLSRRDMRAASGKAMSDSDSDESTSGLDTVHDAADDVDKDLGHIVAPPLSPTQSRDSKTGRRRRRSQSNSQPLDSPPQIRQRSSSFHVQAEVALHAVAEEKAADVDMMHIDMLPGGDSHEQEVTTTHARIEALEKRKEEEAADAKAKEGEAEAKKAEELRGIEEALKAEEDRRMQEAADAAAIIAEAQRMAAQERAQREMEINEALHQMRETCLAALPASLAFTLDPASGFKYSRGIKRCSGEQDHIFLLKRFTPLVSIRQTRTPTTILPTSIEHWVLNVQIAALLGKKGLDLLIPRDTLGFERTMSHGWTTISDFSPVEHMIVSRTVRSLCAPISAENAAWPVDNRSIMNAEDQIRKVIPLYCIKMSDVQQHLDPVISDVQITIHTQSIPVADPVKDNDSTSAKQSKEEGFFAEFCRFTRNYAPIQKYLNGKIEEMGSHVLGVSPYTIVHEK